MMNKDQRIECQHTDTTVDKEIMNGLMAAKQYEKNKPQLSLVAQEELITMHFPCLPDGTIFEQMSKEECMHLRISMQAKAGNGSAQNTANLREQMTEYHSLLDKLSSVMMKYGALEKEFEKRGERIQSLEKEVVVLKRKNSLCVTESCIPLPVSVSCTGMGTQAQGHWHVSSDEIQGHGVGTPMQKNQMPMQQMHEQPVRQTQELPHSSIFQPYLSYFNQNLRPNSSFIDAYEPSSMALDPFSSKSGLLPASQNASPSTPTYEKLPIDYGFHSTSYFSSNDRNVSKHPDWLSSPNRHKRAMFDAVIGVIPFHQQETKRLKNDVFPAPDIFSFARSQIATNTNRSNL
eukprot:CAMPEP_0196143712 /NCGR_PEP_ID=MMETSP0910-20130528/13676_1 /TAXON_ID=49265 /ORGANISM="Thalassiosira rotula, Strain GSO102" /LENGTH=345 /DNA_ID=CAMNT_0041405199 /DNA_START=193 /DNA_END=1230 /DNA_ORIENTATION=-